MLNAEGKTVRSSQPAISLQRLHTWLALIPPDAVTSDTLREKLINTQENFTDVVYAYFGRRILPEELRAEDDPYLNKRRKKLYDLLEEASKVDERLSTMEGKVDDLHSKVDQLSIAISAGDEGDNINADQQEQLKAMIDILSNRYEKKRGKGTRGALINDIKAQHNFRFYNSVPKKIWPTLVRDCVQRFRQLNPKGTALPRVFQIALNSIEQQSLF
jgi:hypothetical protein